MRPALDQVRSTASSGGDIYLVNARGDYLVHPDRAREFGTLRDRPDDWRKDFPYFEALAGTREGSTRLMTDGSGKPSGAAIAPALLAGKEWVAIIETIPAPRGNCVGSMTRSPTCATRSGPFDAAPGS